LEKEKTMTKQERLDAIREAVDLVEQAKELAAASIRGLSGEANMTAYMMQPFEQLLGLGNPYDQSLEEAMIQINDQYGPDDAVGDMGACLDCGGDVVTCRCTHPSAAECDRRELGWDES
jgi:hypothetical protein